MGVLAGSGPYLGAGALSSISGTPHTVLHQFRGFCYTARVPRVWNAIPENIRFANTNIISVTNMTIIENKHDL